MLHLLAQTTQQTGGFRNYSPADWAVFFTLLTALIGTLTASIIAIIKAAQARGDAAEAKTASFANTQRVSDVSKKVEDNRVQQANETNEKIKLAMTAPAAPQVVVVPPIVTPQRADLERTPQAPTPEKMQSGFNDANKPE